MKRSNVVLTEAYIRKAPTKPRAYIIWDRDQPGFGLKVEPTGYKSFCVQFRVGRGRGAKLEKLKLGIPSTMKVADARHEANVRKSQAAEGKDHAQERRDLRTSPTVKDLIDLYEEKGLFVRSGKRAGQPFGKLTAKYTMARLRNHVVPVLGKKRLNTLSIEDVYLLFKKVSEGATAKTPEKEEAEGSGTAESNEPLNRIGAAKKVLRDFSSVCNFAIGKTLLKFNPVKASGISTTDEARSDYLEPEDIKQLGEALDEAVTIHGVNRMAAQQVHLWLLTGLRREEGAALLWSEINFKKKKIILQESKSLRERPLTPEAMAFLEQIKAERETGRKKFDALMQAKSIKGEPKTKSDENLLRKLTSPYVFPAERGNGHYTGTKRYWLLIKRLANLDELFPHLLRHTVGSTAVSSGLSLPLTAVLLGHKNMRSTLTYAHVQDRAALDAATPVTAGIAAALSASSKAGAGEADRGAKEPNQ